MWPGLNIYIFDIADNMKRQLSNGLTVHWQASPEKPIAISNLSDVDEAIISVIQIENESTPEPKRYKHSSKNLFDDINSELGLF